MAYAYNPTYSRGGDWEEHNSRLAHEKSQRDLISTNKPGMGGTHLSFQLLGGTVTRTVVLGQP
jgi:hypothetical protein